VVGWKGVGAIRRVRESGLLEEFERIHAADRNRIAVPINRDPLLAR
jgi:hypothetical protein